MVRIIVINKLPLSNGKLTMPNGSLNLGSKSHDVRKRKPIKSFSGCWQQANLQDAC